MPHRTRFVNPLCGISGTDPEKANTITAKELAKNEQSGRVGTL
jgi:hypothetical protein